MSIIPMATHRSPPFPPLDPPLVPAASIQTVATLTKNPHPILHSVGSAILPGFSDIFSDMVFDCLAKGCVVFFHSRLLWGDQKARWKTHREWLYAYSVLE